MKSIIFYLVITFVLVNCNINSKPIINNSAGENFKIVYAIFDYNLSNDLLIALKERWGATGISVRLNWATTEPAEGVFNFQYVYNIIKTIRSHNLDVSLRVTFGWRNPDWVSPQGTLFTSQDFQLNKTGDVYIQYLYPTLNFCSNNSKFYMKRYYNNLLQYVNQHFPNDVFEVVPSVTEDTELEYPHSQMCGYSNIEKSSFRLYLQNKYSTISNLNLKWNSNFSSFSFIDPSSYNWDNNAPFNFQYNSGRVDWINFRTSVLKNFIDTLADITHSYDFKMGLQLGSIYDTKIEFRGWYDPTSLIENVDAVRVADIVQYRPNFNFAADYLRSITSYWSAIKGRNIVFSTETNWPGFANYSDDVLNENWSTQLISYYERGSNSHYITHWDDHEDTLTQYETDFQEWRNNVLTYKEREINYISNSKAVHLGCSQGNFWGNLSVPLQGNGIVYDVIDFYSSIIPKDLYSLNPDNYDNHCDILTDHMIENNNSYLNNYSSVNFTKGSKFISDKAYDKLMSEEVRVNMGNATWYSDHGFGRFAITNALRNEYNEYRSPVHLIWRTRTDLQEIFPDANLSISKELFDGDYIEWAKLSGCGFAFNPPKPEYPEWVIQNLPEDNTLSIYKYDKNIRKVWDRRADLKRYYSNGHDRSQGTVPINMISWVKEYGFLEEPEIQNYEHWPFIGTNFDNYINPIESKSKSVDTRIENYPNPFNPTTVIKYEIESRDFISIRIYDISGKEIKNLFEGEKEIGSHSIVFDGTNFASGIYYCLLKRSNATTIRKMILVK